jgi:transposase
MSVHSNIFTEGLPLLKIVRKICCGIDIHKKFVVAVIGTTNDAGVTDYQTKEFKTFTDDLVRLRDWLVSSNCREVCMESTGKYWIPIFNVLESECRVFVANPKYVRGIRGNKTDKRDALWLCDLHKHGLVRNSFIPPKQIREIRDLMRYSFKLTNNASSEKNRAQNCLTVSNIMLSSVVSDTFGKSARRIIDKLLANPEDTDFDVAPLMHRGMKSTPEEISRSIQGTLTAPQASKLQTCLDHLADIRKHIISVETAAMALAAPFQHQIDLLLTLPSVTDAMTAITIIGEIGVDMSVFLSARHFCSWAGVVPANNESAGKKKSVRCARAGVYIKPLMVQLAHAVVKSKKYPYFGKRYDQIARRRGKKKAIIAIAHMLLVCIYHMLSRDEPFNPELYTTDKVPGYNRKSKFSVSDAIAMIEKLGATVIMPAESPKPDLATVASG